MVVKQELKAVMARFGDRQEDLAEVLDISPPTMSDKLNSKTDFRQTEIEAIALRYSLSAEDVVRIFFPGIVA